MESINLTERIEFVILDLHNIRMRIEEKMKERIIDHSPRKELLDNLRLWNFTTPKFKRFNRKHHLDQHINDLNVYDAYTRAITRLQEIIIINPKKQLHESTPNVPLLGKG